MDKININKLKLDISKIFVQNLPFHQRATDSDNIYIGYSGEGSYKIPDSIQLLIKQGKLVPLTENEMYIRVRRYGKIIDYKELLRLCIIESQCIEFEEIKNA